MVNRVLLSLLIGVAPIGAVVAQSVQVQAPASDVPVKKVMLFSSGVGYFEHAGAVRGNSATQLRFKTTQINDILKSLMLQDEDGGRVGVITYPSQDPIAKTLRSFQVDITKNPSLADLLNQLRGAKVTIQAQAERMTGTILGVESRNKSVEKGEPLAVGVLNLLAGASIRSIELPAITSLTLDDAQLQDELTKALSALVVARDQDKKPVTINFTGNGERRVRIGYVVETPVWKTSYRLLLDDNSTHGRLQGWAIVENQTESDWNNVSLSLVSGRPLSFTMDLYQPLYATRPNVVPELFAGLRPQVYDGGTEEARPRLAMDAVPASTAPRRIGYGPDGRPLANQLSEVVVTSGVDQVSGAARAGGLTVRGASSVESMGSASSLGELFQYTVAGVTLPRQKSAMIPIVTDSVEIERVSIYNASVLRSNPLNGVRLTNTSGKHLLQGPITVLDHGGYGGDARIDNVPPGQERLLSYGVDLDVKVSMRNLASSDAVVTASIYKGALAISRRLVNSVEYSADNRSTKQKTLVIEHQALPGWKLVDTQKPFETTPFLYRFKGSAPAGKVTTLVVKQEYTQAETIQMLSADLGQLATYSRTGEVPQSVRDAIAKAIRMRQAIVDVEREIAERAQQIAGITAEQNRIRENMKTVAQSTQYYERLLAKLNDQESSIERLQKERETLDAKRNDLRRQLDEYLAALTID